MSEKLLPQANSLDKVIQTFVFVSMSDSYTLADLASFFDFEPRQASYYLNACKYLDLVEDNGEISEFGRNIIANNVTPHKAIYERIITDPVIGKIFAHMLLFPDDNIKDFSVELLTPLYPQYGEPVIIRRASSLKSWCDEIFDKLHITRRT